MRVRKLVALVALLPALLANACTSTTGTSTASSTASTAVRASTAGALSGSPPAATAKFASCPPGTVDARLWDGYVGGATGEHAVAIVLTGMRPCVVAGYPTITLIDTAGHRIPFAYRDGGGQFVTSSPPRAVIIGPRRPGYVLIAKYRCDVGISDTATVVDVSLPADTHIRRLALIPMPGRGHFDLCIPVQSHASDPGNTIGVSPIEADPAHLALP